jgi:hypothetical protein
LRTSKGAYNHESLVPRRGTARTIPITFLCCSMYRLFVLFYIFFYRSVYCLCVNVYCTTATGCQPNCC